MPEPELKVNRRNVAAGVIAAALVVAAIVSLSGGGNDKGSVGVIGDGVSLEDGFTAACVAMWNASGGVAKSMVNTLSAQRPAYASVGPDATFNDRCLLTVAFPDIDSALQFREGGSGGQAWAALGQLSASDLPDSVKGWNVKVVDAGNLALPGSSGGTDTGEDTATGVDSAPEIGPLFAPEGELCDVVQDPTPTEVYVHNENCGVAHMVIEGFYSEVQTENIPVTVQVDGRDFECSSAANAKSVCFNGPAGNKTAVILREGP